MRRPPLPRLFLLTFPHNVAIRSIVNMADAELLASLHAATQLSLADLRDLNLVSTSSPRFGASQDELLARDLWRRELQAHSAVLRDRTLARDLQTALQTDQTIETVRRKREQATQGTQDNSVADHNDAVMLDSDDSDSDSERFRIPTPPPAPRPGKTVSKSTSATLPVSTRPSCYICLGNENLQTRRLDCGHVYCFPCLRDLFRAATRTESLNPASCCKRKIDVGVASGALSAGDRAAYIRSVQEFASGDRLYCASPRCSAFLGSNLSKKKGKAIKCPNCQETTCSACKAPAVGQVLRRFPCHASKLTFVQCAQHLDTQVCAADNDDTAATKLVKLVRGVRCGACRRVVEKNGGCENVCVSQYCALALCRSTDCLPGRCAQNVLVWHASRDLLIAEWVRTRKGSMQMLVSLACLSSHPPVSVCIQVTLSSALTVSGGSTTHTRRRDQPLSLSLTVRETLCSSTRDSRLFVPACCVAASK